MKIVRPERETFPWEAVPDRGPGTAARAAVGDVRPLRSALSEAELEPAIPIRLDVMQTAAIILLATAAIVAVLILKDRFGSAAAQFARPRVTLEDVPRVFQYLIAAPRDGAFAAFLFGPNGQRPAPRDALNVQISIEGGRAGLDWVLLAPLNVAAKERVISFLVAGGHTVAEREANGVAYLRVDGGDVASLCQQLLVDVFSVSRTQELELITEAFVWPA